MTVSIVRSARAMLTFALACAALSCGSDPTGPEIITLFVNSQEVPCQGEAAGMCLVVREAETDEWTAFFDPIEGFDFEPGFLYELLVERHRVPDPPADGSSLRYVLIEIVSKIPA